MKIAICLNGHIRTYTQTIDYLYKNIISQNKHHQLDVFIHTWHTKNTKISYRNLNDPNFSEYDQLTNFDELYDLYKPKEITIEYFDTKRFNIEKYTDKKVILNDDNVFLNKKSEEIFASKLTFDSTTKIHVSTCQTYTFYKSFCNSLNYGPYDCYIKFRFDTRIVKPLILDNFDFTKNVMYGYIWSESPHAQVDFCLGNYNVFKKYSECYLNLKEIYNDIGLRSIEDTFTHYCKLKNINFVQMDYLGSNFDNRDIRLTGYDIIR